MGNAPSRQMVGRLLYSDGGGNLVSETTWGYLGDWLVRHTNLVSGKDGKNPEGMFCCLDRTDVGYRRRHGALGGQMAADLSQGWWWPNWSPKRHGGIW